MQHTRRSGLIIRGLILAGLVGAALTAPPAQAASGPGPYYAEPAWDQQIPGDTRFFVLTDWSSQAVLDKETGLVWERSPWNPSYTWANAAFACADRTIGDRRGWRLPSVHELASLVFPSAIIPPRLPPGHPFSNGSGGSFWSATTNAGSPATAWFVNFSNGGVGSSLKADGHHAWCVRGGMNADQY